MHFISKLQLMYDHLIVSVTPYNCTKPQCYNHATWPVDTASYIAISGG